MVEGGKTERIQKVLDTFGIDEAARDNSYFEKVVREEGPIWIDLIRSLKSSRNRPAAAASQRPTAASTAAASATFPELCFAEWSVKAKWRPMHGRTILSYATGVVCTLDPLEIYIRFWPRDKSRPGTTPSGRGASAPGKKRIPRSWPSTSMSDRLRDTMPVSGRTSRRKPPASAARLTGSRVLAVRRTG